MMPGNLEHIEALTARCQAAEEAAAGARAELARMRHLCQQMLETSALEVLQLKRELQARDRMAKHRADGTQAASAAAPAATGDDDIPFERIEAILASSTI